MSTKMKRTTVPAAGGPMMSTRKRMKGRHAAGGRAMRMENRSHGDVGSRMTRMNLLLLGAMTIFGSRQDYSDRENEPCLHLRWRSNRQLQCGVSSNTPCRAAS